MLTLLAFAGTAILQACGSTAPAAPATPGWPAATDAQKAPWRWRTGRFYY